MQESNVFISIFLASIRPDNVIDFLNNLRATADELTTFEVLLKVDDNNHEIIERLQNYQHTAPFVLKFIATPKLDGYYSLHHGYNDLLKIANPNTYFCWLLTDEIRFERKGWDTTLRKYQHFYADDIFRIKLSVFQLKNYNDFFECLPCPDNYAVTTRKWLEITGGWGNFWGPDSWHQCVDYFLGITTNQQNPYGIWRSFPIFDIKILGQEAGEGENTQTLKVRDRRIWEGWRQHSTHAAQENYNRLALRLNAHIIATENKMNSYIIHENFHKKNIKLMNSDRSVCYGVWRYKLPWFKINIQVGKKRTYSFIHSLPTRIFILLKNVRNKWRTLHNKLSSKQTLQTNILTKSYPQNDVIEYHYNGKYLTRLEMQN